jgi:hypothetical protein
MFFSPNKIKELVKVQTDRQVSQGYIFSLISHLQNYTRELVRTSENELKKLNQDLERHGIRKVERLSSEHFNRAISKSIIYQEDHAEMEAKNHDFRKDRNTGEQGKSEPNQNDLSKRRCQ